LSAGLECDDKWLYFQRRAEINTSTNGVPGQPDYVLGARMSSFLAHLVANPVPPIRPGRVVEKR
jgi:hypothetical protein